MNAEVDDTIRSTGEEFVRALATKDRERLRATLADQIDFKAMTPNRFWEGTTSRQVVDDIILGQWFEAGDHIQEVCSITTGRISDRAHVAYRLRVRNAEGDFLVEQQAYFTSDGGKIDWMRILCSGYRPADAVPQGIRLRATAASSTLTT